MIKAVIFCFFYALGNVSGAAILKWKLKGRMFNHFTDWVNFLFDIQVVGAFALLFCSALILLKALSSGNFSFVIPVGVGINFILTVIAGYYFFKDSVNMVSIVGFTLIISGIIILSLNTSQHAK